MGLNKLLTPGVPIAVTFDSGGISPHSSTLRYDYTVPDDRMLLIDQIVLEMWRVSNGTTNDNSLVNFVISDINDVSFVFKTSIEQKLTSVGIPVYRNLSSVGIVGPGKRITSATSDISVGGNVAYIFSIFGRLLGGYGIWDI